MNEPSIDPMFARILRASREEERQDSFEERVVKKILSFSDVAINLRAIKHQLESETGNGTLTFEWLRDNYPEFPAVMVAAKIRLTADIRMVDLFGSGFMKTPFMREYSYAATRDNWNFQREVYAMAFNLPHADKATIAVVHNQATQVITPDPESAPGAVTRVLRRFGKPPVTFVVESLEGFFHTVGTDWAR